MQLTKKNFIACSETSQILTGSKEAVCESCAAVALEMSQRMTLMNEEGTWKGGQRMSNVEARVEEA